MMEVKSVIDRRDIEQVQFSCIAFWTYPRMLMNRQGRGCETGRPAVINWHNQIICVKERLQYTRYVRTPELSNQPQRFMKIKYTGVWLLWSRGTFQRE